MLKPWQHTFLMLYTVNSLVEFSSLKNAYSKSQKQFLRKVAVFADVCLCSGEFHPGHCSTIMYDTKQSQHTAACIGAARWTKPLMHWNMLEKEDFWEILYFSFGCWQSVSFTQYGILLFQVTFYGQNAELASYVFLIPYFSPGHEQFQFGDK